MLELLEAGGREDPALRRLFVDAYESKEEAHAFHELVDDDLQASKVSSLRLVAGALAQAEVVFDEPQAQEWLRALNDARLAIGARLEVTEEMMGAELDEADPNAPTLALLHWLGWLQESTLQALS
jgi:glutaminase